MQKFISVLSVLIGALLFSCTSESVQTDPMQKAGVKEFYNPASDRRISQYGETVGLTIKTYAPYELELVFQSEDEWAHFEKGATGAAGFNQIRIKFDTNQGTQLRKVEMYIHAEGYEKTLIASFEQSIVVTEQERNITLNRYMHARLQEEYLWAEEYSQLEVDFNIDYRSFLSEYLTKLGEVNIEDGGYTGNHTSEPGKRFIYSNIQPATASVKSLVQNVGLGFGPFFASALNADASAYCLAVSYVHKGSPAEKAGLKRGDAIYMVNNEVINGDNYEQMSDKLFSSTTGSFKLTYYRDGQVGQGKEFNATAVAGAYTYNPIIYTDVIEERGKVIGYMVLESFDDNCQDFLVETVNNLKSRGITDLILDLRFNMGGSVAQSRWLSGCVAGASHSDATFASLIFNDETTEEWKFGGGPSEYDGLGASIDLGLDRLFVIGSYYTASASEMIVHSLRGIGYDVYLVGGRTEGKNVGMTTSHTEVDGVRYVFNPVTFRIYNAKGVSGYADGLIPNIQLSDQDMDYSDGDADVLFPFSFSDWGVSGANLALETCLQTITGSAAAVSTLSSKSTALETIRLIPLGPCPYTPAHGRYGNLLVGSYIEE